MSRGRATPPGWPAALKPYRVQKHEDWSRSQKMVVYVKIDLGNGPEWIPVGTLK